MECSKWNRAKIPNHDFVAKYTRNLCLLWWATEIDGEDVREIEREEKIFSLDFRQRDCHFKITTIFLLFYWTFIFLDCFLVFLSLSERKRWRMEESTLFVAYFVLRQQLRWTKPQQLLSVADPWWKRRVLAFDERAHATYNTDNKHKWTNTRKMKKKNTVRTIITVNVCIRE